MGWLLAAALLLAVSPAAAQTYPARPITFMHGFGAGGNADTIARLIGNAMNASMGVPVVIDAHVGAGGTIASDRAAKAKPDGYTIILLTSGHAVSAGLYKKLPFDAVNDFQMISLATAFPFVISVRKDDKRQSLPELIAAAKAKPGQISFSSVGIGSTQHLSGELLQSMAGIQLNHVPYKGGSAPLTDLLGGQIDVMIDTITVTTPQLKGGTIRALAVTTSEAWPSLPDIPPVAATVPGYDVRGWLGVAGPKGLPQPVLERLNLEVRKALADPTVKARIEDMGNMVTPSSPEEMRQFVAADVAKFTRIIQEAHVPQQE
ncbi:MAG TPA: tripartite tricarboxylate transporter substrate binding protein [Alphaproteobacteria bacterium]